MSEEIATNGLEVNFDNQAPGGLVYGGDLPIDGASVISVDSPKLSIDDSPVCTTLVSYIFTPATPCPHTFAGHEFVAGGGAIPATSQNNFAGELPVMRKNDEGTCAGTWTNTQSGASVPCVCKTKIAESGQEGNATGD